MDVVAVREEVFTRLNEAIAIAPLPYGQCIRQLAREPSTKMLHGARQIGCGQKQMNVIGHQDVGMKLVKTVTAIVLQRLKKERRR